MKAVASSSSGGDGSNFLHSSCPSSASLSRLIFNVPLASDAGGACDSYDWCELVGTSERNAITRKERGSERAQPFDFFRRRFPENADDEQRTTRSASLVHASNQATSAPSERRRHSSTVSRVLWAEVSAVAKANQGATTTLFPEDFAVTRRRQSGGGRLAKGKKRERGRESEMSLRLPFSLSVYQPSAYPWCAGQWSA